MAAIAVFNFTGDYALHQGSDFDVVLNLLQDDGVTPVDVTGLSFEAQARQDYADVAASVVFTFVVTVIDIPTAALLFHVDHSVLAAISSPLEGKWDCESTNGVNRKRRIQGTWAITREVTRT